MALRPVSGSQGSSSHKLSWLAYNRTLPGSIPFQLICWHLIMMSWKTNLQKMSQKTVRIYMNNPMLKQALWSLSMVRIYVIHVTLKQALRSLSLSYQKKAWLAPAQPSLLLVWHWVLKYNLWRQQNPIVCGILKEGLAGLVPSMMTNMMWLIFLIIEKVCDIFWYIFTSWKLKKIGLPHMNLLTLFVKDLSTKSVKDYWSNFIFIFFFSNMIVIAACLAQIKPIERKWN